MLLSTAGGVFLRLAEGQQAQAEQVRALQTTTVDVGGNKVTLFKVDDVPVNGADEVKSWSDLITRIVATGYDIDKFNTSFEAGAFPKLQNVQAMERLGGTPALLTHNPRLVEPLLGEIASLVDRCIAYRNEGAELEIAGVAAGASRLVAYALDEVEAQTIASDVPGSAASVLAARYPTAIDFYKTAADANLGNGNAAQLQGLIDANTNIKDKSATRTSLLMTSLLFKQALNKQILSRYNVPGNAHNFVERFERLRALFESDIEAAYQRAIAASVGLTSIFSYKEPLPELSESGFIDKLLIWTRKAMRAVTLAGEREIEFVKTVSVSVPPTVVAGSPVFKFKVDFPGFRSVRLRAIAASINGFDKQYAQSAYFNSTYAISLIKEDPSMGPNAVAVLPQVRPWGPQANPVNVSGALLYNVNPEGEWTGRISSNVIDGNGQRSPIPGPQGIIHHLIFEFRVVATVDKLDGLYWINEDRV
jgi:hypothetical protein